VAALVLAAALGVAGPSRAWAAPTAADLESARSLFREGRTLREEGSLGSALEKFKAAHALAGTPITAVELGRTYQLLGMWLEAREAWLEVSRIPHAPHESTNTMRARDEAKRLESELAPHIPKILVHVGGAPPGAQIIVTIDDVEIPDAAIREPRLVNPGAHTVTARVQGGAMSTTSVRVAADATAEATLVVSPPAPSPSDPTPEPAPTLPARSHAIAYVGFGVAGVGVAVGTAAGIVAFSKTSTVKGECQGTQCPGSAQGDIDASRTAGTISTVAFVAAGAGLVVRIVGLVTGKSEPRAAARPARVAPSLAPGVAGAQIKGTF
jgi:hypothetical protein